MVPSRHAQKAARRGDGSPSPTGPRERDTKGANDAKQRRKVEPADLDAARRESEKAMRRLSTHDKEDLPLGRAREDAVDTDEMARRFKRRESHTAERARSTKRRELRSLDEL